MREATPESQEHRTEIRIEVSGAEYPDFSLDLTQTILKMRLDAASEPEIVKEKKQEGNQEKNEELRLDAASNPEAEKKEGKTNEEKQEEKNQPLLIKRKKVVVQSKSRISDTESESKA